jgi:integrase
MEQRITASPRTPAVSSAFSKPRFKPLWSWYQIAANVTIDAPGAHDTVIKRAKYPGLHAIQHFYASWCINRKADGGLELRPKVVQERLGHSTIAMMLDVYGHLFPCHDDSEELATAERTLLAWTSIHITKQPRCLTARRAAIQVRPSHKG